MFETATLSTGPKSKRMWATGLGFAGQAVLIGGMLVAPLIWPKALPDIARSISLAPPAPQGAPKPMETRVEPRPRASVARTTHVFTEPQRVPDRVMILTEPETPEPSGPSVPGALPDNGGGRSNNSLIAGVLDSVGRSTPVIRPPDPVVTKPPEPSKPVRVTEVRMAEPIQRVNPVYPEMAKRTRVSGKVELMGVLGVDGRIHEIKVISGHPFLVKAAVDAVMQWVYRPTILNGQPVEVQAPITVNFILNN
jgi:periplasmic protein TonB